jgi:acyl-CoA thioesterase FadM
LIALKWSKLGRLELLVRDVFYADTDGEGIVVRVNMLGLYENTTDNKFARER